MLEFVQFKKCYFVEDKTCGFSYISVRMLIWLKSSGIFVHLLVILNALMNQVLAFEWVSMHNIKTIFYQKENPRVHVIKIFF